MGHGTQQFVAARRFIAVVAIELDVDQGGIAATIAQSRQFGNQALAQVAGIGQAGQRIVAEFPAQALGSPPLGDVAEDHDRAVAASGQR